MEQLSLKASVSSSSKSALYRQKTLRIHSNASLKYTLISTLRELALCPACERHFKKKCDENGFIKSLFYENALGF
jgi:hypothetical protein